MRGGRFHTDGGNVFVTAPRYTNGYRRYRFFAAACTKTRSDGGYCRYRHADPGYFRIICAVDTRRISNGIASGCGIAFLLERFPAPMYAFILGLVAGSLFYLYPHTTGQPFAMRIVSGTVLLIGYAAVSFFSNREAPERQEDAVDEE